MGGLNQAFKAQGGLNGLLASPSFNAGLGILSGRTNQEAALGALQGLQSAQSQRQMQANQAREKKLKDELQKIFAAQQAQRAQQAGSSQVGQLPNPQLGNLPPGVQGMLQPPPGPPPILQQPPTSPSTSSDQVSQLMLQYGTPQQQQNALSQMSASDRYRAQVAREEKRFAEQGDSVQSKSVLEDGRILKIYRSGKEALAKLGGEDARAFNPAQFIKAADGSIYRADKTTGEIAPALSQQDAAEGIVATQTAKQTAQSKNQGLLAAQSALPKIEFASERVLGLIDKVRNHPGLDSSVGSVQGKLPGYLRPGPSSDFDAAFEQLEGAAFLEAIEELKNTGTITDFEGKKATDAILGLSKTQSEKSFREGLDSFSRYIRDKLDQSRKSAGELTSTERSALRSKYLK